MDIIITSEDTSEYKRLDACLSAKIPDLSRSLIKKLFQDGAFSSQIKLELKKMPPEGTQIFFEPGAPKAVDIQAENIPLEILFEDEYLIIINKPAGIVVHPAPGNYTGTLVNAILHHCPDLKGVGHEKRPGIVHRLDKGTSGVMVIAKEQLAHNGLVELFSTHTIDRQYEAICLGTKMQTQGVLDAPIGRSPHNRIKMASNVEPSKRAITNYKVTQYFEKFSHLELTLHTGRTHQIRVHLSELLNAPILNDLTYGRTKEEKTKLNGALKKLLKDYEHPLLHAKKLGFIHPITQEKLLFETSPPQIFQEALKELKQSHDANS